MTAPEELPSGSRVVGDLHLDVERPEHVAGFVSWLEGLGDCPRLVLLGDVFEYWIGMAQARSAGGRTVLGALRERTAGGTRVDVLHGNRDFLLDGRFEAATGARVHADGLGATSPGGQRIGFLHGDELCTLDHAYQRLRRVLRSGPLTFTARRLPGFVGEAVARRIRRASRRAVAAKPGPTKAQQPGAVRAELDRRALDVLVVGHAHRYRDEAVSGGGRWIVVDGFGGPRDCVHVDDAGALVVEGSGARFDPPPETGAAGP